MKSDTERSAEITISRICIDWINKHQIKKIKMKQIPFNQPPPQLKKKRQGQKSSFMIKVGKRAPS